MDKCSDFDINEYIEYVLRLENKELYKKIDTEFEKVLDKIYGRIYGRDVWKNLKEKFSGNDNIETTYLFSVNQEKKILQQKITYKYTCNYPFLYNCLEIAHSKETIKLSDLVIELSSIKSKFIEDLRKSGLSSPAWTYTWGELMSLRPHCIEWWIEEILKERTLIDRVVIVTEEEDLKNLKNVLRS